MPGWMGREHWGGAEGIRWASDLVSGLGRPSQRCGSRCERAGSRGPPHPALAQARTASDAARQHHGGHGLGWGQPPHLPLEVQSFPSPGPPETAPREDPRAGSRREPGPQPSVPQRSGKGRGTRIWACGGGQRGPAELPSPQQGTSPTPTPRGADPAGALGRVTSPLGHANRANAAASTPRETAPTSVPGTTAPSPSGNAAPAPLRQRIGPLGERGCRAGAMGVPGALTGREEGGCLGSPQQGRGWAWEDPGGVRGISGGGGTGSASPPRTRVRGSPAPRHLGPGCPDSPRGAPTGPGPGRRAALTRVKAPTCDTSAPPARSAPMTSAPRSDGGDKLRPTAQAPPPASHPLRLAPG